MEFAPQVKTALNELPPQERVIALALKNIYEQIKEIHEEEQKEIDANHLGFLTRFKDFEVQASKIINGKQLSKSDLADPDQYLLEGEKGDLEKCLNSTESIQGYWLTTLKNSIMADIMKEFDDSILSHLTNISTNVTTDTIEIQLTFNDNEYLPASTINRILKLQNGRPVEFKGDKITPKKTIAEDSLFHEICTDTTDQAALVQVMEVVAYIANELVPYSLKFYLGSVDNDQQFDEEDEEEDEDEDEEEGEKPVKKSKPN